MNFNEILNQSQSVTLQRSVLHLSNYNPRKISEEGRKQLKKSIKQFGVLGGIVVNKRTNYTVVSGHQKITILDMLSNGKDYSLRVELIDVDEKTEKEINITMNNPNVGGEWDYDKLADLIPDIDWQAAGLTEADLSVIGVDYGVEVEPVSIDDAVEELQELQELAKPPKEDKPKKSVEELKETKHGVIEQAQKKIEKMTSYVVLTFDTAQAMDNFLMRFGYPPNQQYIKGEEFDDRCEVSYD